MAYLLCITDWSIMISLSGASETAGSRTPLPDQKIDNTLDTHCYDCFASVLDTSEFATAAGAKLSVSTGTWSLTTSHVGKTARPTDCQICHIDALGCSHLPSKMVFTASGTLPPFHSVEFIPYETACAKLSCPLKIPEKRANSEILSVLVDSR